MMRPTVLIADGDSALRRSLAFALEEAGFAAAESPTFADVMGRLDGFAYDALIVDVRLPGGDGLDVLDAAHAKYPGIRSVVLSTFGSIHHAVRALKSGAREYLLKPVPTAQLVECLKKHCDAHLVEYHHEKVVSNQSFAGILGSSPSMTRLFQTLHRVAPMHSTVLIGGETGTGKELVARTIHDNSPRRDFPFVAFNAAAIPEGLAEAELFGHMKGAFTGAVYTRVGRFEAADRGTLFIDEIASMPLVLQAKVLRAIQEREVERVGASRPLKVNTRIIAASNVDLSELVRQGRFREDLFYRLNVINVDLPPLRERLSDVPTLAQHFIEETCKANGLEIKVLTQPALQALMAFSWPGNVRHLHNAIESAVVMSGESRELTVDVLPAEILAPPAEVRTAILGDLTMPETPTEGINFAAAMSNVERELILTYLRRANGNKRQAARMLSLSRTTLIDKLHRLGMSEVVQSPAVEEAVA